MEKKVVSLIKDIIGNGAPCSKQNWNTIKTALAEAEKTANNKHMFQLLCEIKKFLDNGHTISPTSAVHAKLIETVAQQ